MSIYVHLAGRKNRMSDTPFKFDDPVWFDIGGEVYEARVITDDGGLEVLVDIVGGPIIMVSRTIIKHE